MDNVSANNEQDYSTPICVHTAKVNQSIRDFINGLATVGEESLTDFLLWQWKTESFSVIPFNRITENKTTGADFELFFITEEGKIRPPLVIQAKRFFTDSTTNYIKKSILYGEKDDGSSGKQLETLIQYCSDSKLTKIPLYLTYANPKKEQYEFSSPCTDHRCNMISPEQTGAFITRLETIQELIEADRAQIKNKRISLKKALENSIPLHKLFCNLRPNNGGSKGPDDNPPSSPNPPSNLDEFLSDFNKSVDIPDFIDQILQPGADVKAILEQEYGKGDTPSFIAIFDLTKWNDKGTSGQQAQNPKEGDFVEETPITVSVAINAMEAKIHQKILSLPEDDVEVT